MADFIETNRGRYGVESICSVLPIAPSTFYEHQAREKNPDRLPARAKRDAKLRVEIDRVWRENRQVYGVRKVWKQLNRETDATRAQAERISNRIDQQRRENTFFEIQGIMDELDSRNLSMEGAADGINLTKDHQLLVGVQPQEFNDIVLDAVAAKALDLKDPGVFKVLDSIATGTGVLGRTSKARDTVARITSGIASDLEDKDRFDAEQEDRLREEAARTSSSTIQSVLFENNLNGNATTLEQVAEAMRDLALADPRLAQSMRQAIITSALPGKEDDPQMRQDLYLGLFENGRIDRVQVAGAFNAGTITLATFKDLLGLPQNLWVKPSSIAA